MAKNCHCHLVQDMLRWMFPLLLRAVTVSLWMLWPLLSCSSAFPLALPVLALEAALPEALHISAEEGEGVVSFLVLMKWVTFQQSPLERSLLLPNWGACCSDVTLPSLQSSRISREETNCFKSEGKCFSLILSSPPCSSPSKES